MNSDAAKRHHDVLTGERAFLRESLDISVEQDRIVLTAAKKKQYEAKIIEDPITGLPVIDVGPDAPVLTSEMVRELLVDFP